MELTFVFYRDKRRTYVAKKVGWGGFKEIYLQVHHGAVLQAPGKALIGALGEFRPP